MLQSHPSCNSGAGGASVYLRKPANRFALPGVPSRSSNERHKALMDNRVYLSFCKHAHVGCRLGGELVFAVGEDCAVEEGQIFTAWMIQLDLREIG